MNLVQVKEFVSLENEKQGLDARLKLVKQELGRVEESLIRQFMEAGIQSIKVDGRTVYLSQDVYASPLNDRSEVVAALKASDLGQYVGENYNTNSLTAYVREIKREVELAARGAGRPFTEEDIRAALPAPLGDVLKVGFVHKVSSCKS